MVDGGGSRGVGVLYTGGTIGMRSIAPELDPGEDMLRPDEVLDLMRVRSGLEVPFELLPLRGTEGKGFEPLVSSRITPGHWVQIAETILDHYADFDGFVVLHGTDTMAWTASALSFMFDNLGKPVVLTGSQRPIAAAPSDAVSNFVSSVLLAGGTADSVPVIPEVVICFGDVVLRGNRSTKISAASLHGFDTPNAPHLGRVGRRFEIDADQLRPAPAAGDGCYLRTRLETRVADVVLYPGMPPSLLRTVLNPNRGAVLRTFGAGNAPGGPELQRVLREAVDEGKVLVNVTQTDEGTVEAGMLTGSRALTDCGVLSGLDLTAEAALTKLMVLLGSHTRGVARTQMQLDLRGEQSMDLVELRASARRRPRGTYRLELSPALQARARSDRLASAVLRVRGTSRQDLPGRTEVDLHLNDRHADQASPPGPRMLGRSAVGHRVPGGPEWDGVLDVTDACRGLLRTGEPVTLTAVPVAADAPDELEAVLTLFTERVVSAG